MAYTCNICGAANHHRAEQRHRELAPCASCGSNARFRALIASLLTGLGLPQDRPLCSLAPDKGVRGVGFSDWAGYALPLERAFRYVNTFLHKLPYADLADGASLRPYHGVQFAICSDVIEHVVAGPHVVLRNLYERLVPGGVLVLSAPTFDMPSTIETYPGIAGYRSLRLAGRRFVVWWTRAGRIRVDAAPVFHGGEGSAVLELRLFSHQSLIDEILAAGFRSCECLSDEALERHGATWPTTMERAGLPFLANGRVLLAAK